MNEVENVNEKERQREKKRREVERIIFHIVFVSHKPVLISGNMQ